MSDVQACFLPGSADTEMGALFAGALIEQAAVMAKRKKRVAARRGKAATRGKARKPAKSVRGKSAKRTSARATPKKRVTKAKSKHAVVKTLVPTVETVIVDMIEEPVPGVMVVTEFEATGTREPNATPKQPKESRAAATPESEEL
jgi:hypothetical protein